MFPLWELSKGEEMKEESKITEKRFKIFCYLTILASLAGCTYTLGFFGTLCISMLFLSGSILCQLNSYGFTLELNEKTSEIYLAALKRFMK